MNFSGKLPFTVARTEEEYPPIIGIGDKPYVIEYGYYHGYTLFDKEKRSVAYPFGYGLSYTEFQIGDFDIKLHDEVVKISTSVKNIGKFAGADVIQVYFGSNDLEKERPVKLLKGFNRVELQPGEEKTVEIIVEFQELKFYSPKWLDTGFLVYCLYRR